MLEGEFEKLLLVNPQHIKGLDGRKTDRREHAEDLTRVRNQIEQLVEGKRDAGWMADYARGTLRNKKRALEAALEGTFTVEQRWLLSRELLQMEGLEQQVATMEEEIEQRVAGFNEQLRRLLTIPGWSALRCVDPQNRLDASG